MKNKINLFCFPYAGGNKHSFEGLKQYLDDHIAYMPLELPGRGTKFNLGLMENIHHIVDHLYEELEEMINQPSIFYAHSMGGTVANLILRKLYSENKKLPVHFFVTGHRGPSSRKKDEKTMHLLSNDEFKEELRTLGGCPDEVLENEELLNFFVPILKSDFKAVETYEYETAPKYPVNITSIIGSDEDINHEEQKAWEGETSKSLTMLTELGNHFFILNSYEKIGKMINKVAANYLKYVLI